MALGIFLEQEIIARQITQGTFSYGPLETWSK